MNLALVIVGACILVASGVATRPLRWNWLSSVTFTVGWLTSELAGQLLVADLCFLAVALAIGIHGALGWVGLTINLLAAALLVVHVVSGIRSLSVVEAGLAAARGGPIRLGAARRPIYGRWWRVIVAVPLRLRGVKVTRDLDYVGDGHRRHRLDVYAATTPESLSQPVLLYIHGGAWVIGDKSQQAIPMLNELASRGWVCVAINYRLSPKATWPDHVVDCKRAIAWVKEHIADFGGDPSTIAVAGGSAGGHLATLCALTANDPAFQPGFESADTSLAAGVSIYGVLEMTGDPQSSGRHGDLLVRLLEREVMKRRLSEDRAVFEAASPLHRIHADAPPMLVLQGRNDTLVPVDVARQFVQRFVEVTPAPLAYVELPLAQHAFDILASPRCTATTAGIVAFLERVVANR
jgi:dienelactone hydrolase